MATTDRLTFNDPVQEIQEARKLAARYRCEFVDLREANGMRPSTMPPPSLTRSPSCNAMASNKLPVLDE